MRMQHSNSNRGNGCDDCLCQTSVGELYQSGQDLDAVTTKQPCHAFKAFAEVDDSQYECPYIDRKSESQPRLHVGIKAVVKTFAEVEIQVNHC